MGAPSTWIAGVAGAEAGLHMVKRPRVGQTWLQGISLDIDFWTAPGYSPSAISSASRSAATARISAPTSGARSTRRAGSRRSSTRAVWGSSKWVLSTTRRERRSS